MHWGVFFSIINQLSVGGVAKWSKATVCKTVISWVRIPPPPVIFKIFLSSWSGKIPLFYLLVPLHSVLSALRLIPFEMRLTQAHFNCIMRSAGNRGDFGFSSTGDMSVQFILGERGSKTLRIWRETGEKRSGLLSA